MNHFNTNHLTNSLLKSQPAFRSKRTRFSPLFKFVLLVIALCANCFMTHIANAQAPTLEWVKSMGGSGQDVGSSIAVDASGNVYTTGYFQGTVDFNPGPGVFNLSSVGAWNAFISKLDGAGNFMWAKSLIGAGTVEGVSIAVDGGGNVYTTGNFYGTVDFDPGVGIFNIASIGSQDIYISKLNAAGNFIWAKTIGGGAYEYSYGLKIDAFDNVITAGRFSGTVDFNPNAGVFNITASSTNNTFISKLDASGNFIWAKSMGGPDGFSYLYSFSIDASGAVLTTGQLGGTIDFDPNSGVFNLISAGYTDIFISKLDAAGNFVWAKRMGSSGGDLGTSIRVDALGNVYTAGIFKETVDFDPNAGVANLTAMDTLWGDIFISKIDAAGNFIWAKRMGGGNNIVIEELAMDDLNNLYCTGQFAGTADFNPNAGIFNLVSAGNVDIFILKLDPLGNFVWAKSMGGVGTDIGNSIAVDAAKNVYTTGYFTNTVDFNPDAGVANVTSNGNEDFFVHKMGCLLPPPAPANTTASSSTTICYGATTTLSVSAVGTAGWYSAATGGTYLGGGNSFTTPELIATTTFYVQDSMCAASASRTPINVTVRPLTSLGTTSVSPSAICLGESTNLTYTAPSCYSNPNFEYTYAPANWILNQSPANANGSVSTTNAPSSITMVSSNGAIGGGSGTTSYSITIPCSGFVSFNWAYSTLDAAAYDYPRFSINGGTPNLFTGFSTSGATTQTGSISILMIAGQTLTLQSYSLDNQLGACTTVISNFSAPAIPNQMSQWYTAASGGAFLGSGLNFAYTPIAVGNNTYYAAVVDVNTSCVNPIRVPVEVWVNPLPKAGIATATSSSPCIGANVNLNYMPPTCESSLGFQHPNSPTNWTLTQSPIFANGTVNVTNVPSSITMTSSNAAVGGGPGTTSYSIVMPCSGFVSFNWNYSTVDGAAYDYPQYRINSGAPVLLTGYNTAGANSQSGTVNVAVTTGQTFTLQSYSVDNQLAGCTTIISNFSAPGVPNQSVKWYSAASGGTDLGGGNTLSITPATTGTLTYYAEVKDNNTGCINTLREPTNSVIISALPSVVINASNNPICLGSSTTLTASGAASYIWYPGGLGGASVVVAPTATTTYTVIGIDANGCSKSSTLLITVNPLPGVGTSASSTTICAGSSTNITGTNAATYTWQPGSLSGTTITVSPATSTTYTVTGTSSLGCVNTATRSITVNPLPPTGTNLGTTPSICTGTAITIFGSGANAYTWQPGSLTGPSITVSPSSTTTYTVTGISTVTGCTKTFTQTIIVNPLPNVGTTATTSAICIGGSATITGTGANTYTWNPGSLSGTTITVSPLTTTTYTVSGTNTSTGCTNTSTRTITVNACGSVLNLTLLIEGYYQGMGTMDHVLQNQTVVGATPTQTDTILVELRNAFPPHAVASSVKTILNTNGMASCNFPLSGNYYIAIKHRNGLETWSATPIAMTGIVNYNFTTSANQAYGSNQVEVEPGIYALFTGDLNQDENIDLLDLSPLEIDINNFSFGYFATDINGDGNVDLLDNPLIEQNINNFVFSVHP